MIILLAIGASVFAAGIYTLIPIIQFYVGQRRDLYFHPETTWMTITWWGGVQLLIGSGLMAVALLLDFDGTALVFLLTLGLIVTWWVLSPPLLRRFPPRWISEFEKGRSPTEIEAVRQNGSALLRTHPKAFRQVLYHPAGWDMWLMTVTSLIPMASLEVYERRAQQAIAHNLFPIAVVAANRIIHYRPDKPLGYELRAQAYLKDHQYNRALQDFSIVLEKKPHDAEAYYQRARIYMIMELPEQAMDDLNRAVELLPGEARFHTLREAAARVAAEKSA